MRDAGWCWEVGGEQQSDEIKCDRQGKETGIQTGRWRGEERSSCGEELEAKKQTGDGRAEQ